MYDARVITIHLTHHKTGSVIQKDNIHGVVTEHGLTHRFHSLFLYLEAKAVINIQLTFITFLQYLR